MPSLIIVNFLLYCQSAAYKSWPCQQVHVDTRLEAVLPPLNKAVPWDNGGCESPKNKEV